MYALYFKIYRLDFYNFSVLYFISNKKNPLFPKDYWALNSYGISNSQRYIATFKQTQFTYL